ncbi:MAG: hypothetical protein HY958_07810 [Bacteroidia bacterium]|nr:hypothetical protein [Bacteroidia bacterium]
MVNENKKQNLPINSSLRFLCLCVSLLTLNFITAFCQNKETLPDSSITSNKYENKRGYFRVMFYNVENLFDTQRDTSIDDKSFLPEGDHHWTPDKYQEKLKHIAKVIVAVGGWDPPAVVGLCEVENKKVLEDLTKNTPLSQLNYSIIHHNSPDARGIDVAMLYRKEDFKPIFNRPIPVKFTEGKKTRDILYVKGITGKKDTLHIFVNHWPSKFGGEIESEPRRIFVGKLLRGIVDSIFSTNFNANIIIIGDLNDNPENTSVCEGLGTKIKYDIFTSNELYNLTNYAHYKHGLGSLKYQGTWDIIDNIIVSGAMLNMNNKVYTTLDDAHIFNAPFLLEKDERNFGFQPNRTYVGLTYHGGFSDHLPVYLDLRKNYEKK